MKIDNNLSGIQGIRTRGARAEKDKKGGERPAGSTGGDSVAITSTSSRLQALEAILADIDVQDVAKIEEIRQAISEGRFHVDEQAVADALIETTLEQLRLEKG